MKIINISCYLLPIPNFGVYLKGFGKLSTTHHSLHSLIKKENEGLITGISNFFEISLSFFGKIFDMLEHTVMNSPY